MTKYRRYSKDVTQHIGTVAGTAITESLDIFFFFNSTQRQPTAKKERKMKSVLPLC